MKDYSLRVNDSNRGIGTMGSDGIIKSVPVSSFWNPKLNAAMASHLQKRYLIDDQHRHGLYLIAWCACDQWNDSDNRKKQVPKMTITEAQAFFDKQAVDLSKEGHQLRALVLNTALPGKQLQGFA